MANTALRANQSPRKQTADLQQLRWARPLQQHLLVEMTMRIASIALGEGGSSSIQRAALQAQLRAPDTLPCAVQVFSPPHLTPPHLSSPLLSTALLSSPLRSTPLHSTPLRSTPLHSSPVQSSPVQSTPVHSNPIQSNPIHSLTTHQNEPTCMQYYDAPAHLTDSTAHSLTLFARGAAH